MATLLMVESWVNSTGRSLPPLLRDLGHDYVLLTRDPGLYPPSPSGRPHPVVAGADEVVVVDTNDIDAVGEAAATVARRRRIDGVLTTCDYYLGTAATLAERLGLPGAPPTVMQGATRKHLVRAALDRFGLPNPTFAVAATWAGARAAAARLGMPLVAKPVDLNAGTSVRLVTGEGDLKDAFWDVRGREHNTRGQPLQRLLLLEEVLTGAEVSVEAVTVDGRTTVVGITDKSVAGPPAFVESGHMFPARLDRSVAASVEAFVVDALAAIGFTHGVSHTEVMVTSDGPRLVEINPRQGGGHIFDLVQLVTGTNTLEATVDLALGNRPRLGRTDAPLPSATVPGGSAAVFFVLSRRPGRVERVSGLDRAAGDPRVLTCSLPTPVEAPRPLDNEAYLGRVVTVDPAGGRARAYAEEVVGALRLHFADGTSAAPLGVPSGL
jgi:D-alanine-D-alanine ligase-like ATP-grasp enzyme